jgi:PEP-CTERM motif
MENHMSTKKYFHLLTAGAAMAVLSGLASFSSADPVVVDPTNPDGWTLATVNGGFLADPSAGTAAFVTGPGTPPLGIGSAHLATTAGGGDGGAMIGTAALDGLPLSAITSLSYSTYMTTNNAQQFPYIAISFASTGVGPADDNIIFEPPYQTAATGNPSLPDQGPTALNTWQTWDAEDGGWWDGNGVAGTPGSGVMSLATAVADYPNAVIADFPAPFDSFLGVEFQVGLGSAGETFDGNVDNVTLGVNGVDTTYDFEPAAVPEPASFSLLGIGALALLRRRRRA